MKSFLEIVANDLYRRSGGHLENVTIVFPNKRASLFMNQYIGRITNHPVWSPRYTTISELFQSMTDLTVADPILLNCYLYDAYAKEAKTSETFDHFYSWGEVLLADFEDIDSNMVEADALFTNVGDLEKLTSLDYLTEAQVSAIRQFFNTFSADEKTDLHHRFLEMWNMMPGIYSAFRQSLEAEGLAYEGMMKRHVIEHFDASRLDSNTIYAVVGFNALSATERQLFRRLKSECGALFYWDYDPEIDTNETGVHILRNMADFPSAIDISKCVQECRQQSDATCPSAPSTASSLIVASPTDNAQCRFVGNWLTQHLSPAEPQNRTAVVLCDENLLQPVLHSVPPTTADGQPVQLNITMGYPMQETPMSSLLMSLLNLQVKGWRDDHTLYYRAVEQVLCHPYIQALEPQASIRIVKDLQRHNNAYPQSSVFYGSAVLRQIFTRCTGALSILKYVKGCVELLTRVDSSKHASPLATESIFNAWLMTNRLLAIAEQGRLPIQNTETLLRLFRHIIASKSIPFHGEPAIGVQVMGVLETRNLDFDNIIMLSVGEGIMPRASHQSSFIPYTLRKAYGMTTTEHNDSIYAYYFNRLRHRARHITYLYNCSTDGLHKGEMSRFLIDLKLNADARVASLSCPTLPNAVHDANGNIDSRFSPQEIPDTHLSLSPSAINCYINCPFQYYLTYICGIREQEDVDEGVEATTFGSIFHKAMEIIYAPYVGKGDLQQADIKGMADNADGIEQTVRDAFTQVTGYQGANLTGEQLLNIEVVCRYVNRQLLVDASLCPLRIIGVETEIALPFGGRGIIDREDIATVGGKRVHRIVDYKTGKPQTTKDIASLFDTSKPHSSNILQTLYYCEAVLNRPTDAADDSILSDLPSVSPVLNYITTSSPDHDNTVKINKTPVADYRQYRQDFLPRLQAVVEEIRSSSNQFLPNPNDKGWCQYCQFAPLCKELGHSVSKPND